MTKNERKKAHAEAQKRYREKLASQGLKEVTIKVPIGTDPNQLDLAKDDLVSKIRQRLDAERSSGRNLYAPSNKYLLALIQDIEEIIK